MNMSFSTVVLAILAGSILFNRRMRKAVLQPVVRTSVRGACLVGRLPPVKLLSNSVNEITEEARNDVHAARNKRVQPVQPAQPVQPVMQKQRPKAVRHYVKKQRSRAVKHYVKKAKPRSRRAA